MAKEFFKNFPEIQYKLDSGKIVTIKDFFRKSQITGAAREAVVNYTFHELEEGDRPDVLASKLYGNGDLHWSFFLVNDFDNYYDWWKDSQTMERYVREKYSGKYFVADASTDIVSSTSKFLVGETITGTNSLGYITAVEPTYNRIAVDVVRGFVNPVEATGSSSGKTFTPDSIIAQQDGVAYYYKDDIRRNTFQNGYSSKSNWEYEYELNEEKRLIKIIKPSMINAVVNQFEKIMKS